VQEDDHRRLINQGRLDPGPPAPERAALIAIREVGWLHRQIMRERLPKRDTVQSVP
jgi:hypothetical protein